MRRNIKIVLSFITFTILDQLCFDHCLKFSQKPKILILGAKFERSFAVVSLSKSVCVPYIIYAWLCHFKKINRIYDGVEAETRKSQASFQVI